MSAVAITTDNRVITKSGLVSCTCCPPPIDPGEGGGAGQPCPTIFSLNPPASPASYPPAQGIGTLGAPYTSWRVVHLNNNEFEAITIANGSICETANSSFTMRADRSDSFRIDRFAQTVQQQTCTQRSSNTGLNPRFLGCYYSATNIAYAETGASYLQAGLLTGGVYTNCQLPLAGGLSNISLADQNFRTYAEVFIVRDHRDIPNENKTHLLLVRLQIVLEQYSIALNNPYSSAVSNEIELTNVDIGASTHVESFESFPAGSVNVFSANIFGKTLPLSFYFRVNMQELPVFNACRMPLLPYLFSNVFLSGSYSLTFVPPPP